MPSGSVDGNPAVRQSGSGDFSAPATYPALATGSRRIPVRFSFQERLMHFPSQTLVGRSNVSTALQSSVGGSIALRIAGTSTFEKRWSLTGTTRFSSGFPVTLSNDTDTRLLGTFGNGVNTSARHAERRAGMRPADQSRPGGRAGVQHRLFQSAGARATRHCTTTVLLRTRHRQHRHRRHQTAVARPLTVPPIAARSVQCLQPSAVLWARRGRRQHCQCHVWTDCQRRGSAVDSARGQNLF